MKGWAVIVHECEKFAFAVQTQCVLSTLSKLLHSAFLYSHSMVKKCKRSQNNASFYSLPKTNQINLACTLICNVQACKITLNWYFTRKKCKATLSAYHGLPLF